MQTALCPQDAVPSVHGFNGAFETTLLIIPIRSASSLSWYCAVIFDILLYIGEASNARSPDSGECSNSICKEFGITYKLLISFTFSEYVQLD